MTHPDPAILALPLDQLPDPLPIPVLPRPFNLSLTPPGSKSLTNRALLLAALADGSGEGGGAESVLHNPLIDADDTRVMIHALRALGAIITAVPAALPPSPPGRSAEALRGGESSPSTSSSNPPPALRVRGVSGRWRTPSSGLSLHLESAGTAVRFLTAAALLSPPNSPPITIDASPRMRLRPIADLLTALRSLGARIDHLASNDSLPIRIHPLTTPPSTPTITLGPTASSQFISALLLIAPFLPRGLRIRSTAELTSPDYIWMTLALLRHLGIPGEPGQDPAAAATAGLTLDWLLPHSPLRPFDLTIEPDATSATYFQAAAALIPGAHIEIRGLPAAQLGSLQGDVKFPLILEQAGALFSGDPDRSIEITGAPAILPIDADFSHIPDTAMTAAVLACFASPTPSNPTATSTLRGLRTLRHKESDRLAALQTELTKLGAHIAIESSPTDELLRISPPRHPDTSTPRPLSFDTYNDHRLAMSLALIGLRRPNIHIRNPACVAKTYPTFWRDLARLYT